MIGYGYIDVENRWTGRVGAMRYRLTQAGPLHAHARPRVTARERFSRTRAWNMSNREAGGAKRRPAFPLMNVYSWSVLFIGPKPSPVRGVLLEPLSPGRMLAG